MKKTAPRLLKTTLDRDLPLVSADREAIEQAILNLLNNAIKYSHESREIALRLFRDRGDAAIQVMDQGVGIALKDQARIFERFYRVPSEENQRIPGAGLGLTLVEHIVKAHGGSVGVESKPEEGSTFTIRLPLESRAATLRAGLDAGRKQGSVRIRRDGDQGLLGHQCS